MLLVALFGVYLATQGTGQESKARVTRIDYFGLLKVPHNVRTYTPPLLRFRDSSLSLVNGQ